MIDSLVQILAQDPGLSAEEILDVLWVAATKSADREAAAGEVGSQPPAGTSPEVHAGQRKSVPESDGADDAPVPARKDAVPAKREAAPARIEENADRTGGTDVGIRQLYLEDDARGTEETGARHVPATEVAGGAPRSVSGPLRLQMALRHLARIRSPGQITAVDIDATVEATADAGGRLMTVLTRPAQRALDLALVVDGAPSMDPWAGTLDELEQLLAQAGVFRSLSRWTLRLSGPAPYLESRAGRTQPPSRLIDSSGRRIVLLATDGRDDGWYSAAVWGMLDAWCTAMPTGLLHMLPQHYWATTAVGDPYLAATAVRPAVPNSRYVRRLAWWTDDPGGVPLPVVTLSAQSVEVWAQVVAGGTAWATGISVVPPAPDSVPRAAEGDLDPLMCVNDFRSRASPGAQRLARILASADILSMRLIEVLQHRLAPDTGVLERAEVLAGGLLIRDRTANGQALFRYRPGIPAILRRGTTTFEEWDAYATVSQYLEDLEPVGPSRALVADPEEAAKPDSFEAPFVALHESLVVRLGLRHPVATLAAVSRAPGISESQNPTRGKDEHALSDATDNPVDTMAVRRAPSLARIVAVIAETASGQTTLGTGYLLDASRVLTARHCVTDSQTGRSAASLRVVRASNGAAAPAAVDATTPNLDLALLAVAVDARWEADLPGGPTVFGSLDRERALQLDDCQAVGFRRWQDVDTGERDLAEVRGVIRVAEGTEGQHLLLDPVLAGVTDADGERVWTGFSGAPVFHSGLLLGVVIEHHPWQGATALRVRPIDAVVDASDPETRQFGEALGLSRDGAFRPVTGSVPTAESSNVPTPPIAKQVPVRRFHHGDIVTDPYAWLTDPKDPEVIAYLEAENTHMQAQTSGLRGLRSAVFGEIRARTQLTDLSVPVRKGNWWRYERTMEGQQYAIHCRRLVRDGEVTPPLPADGQPLDGEEVLLDENELAEGKTFFSLGALSVSPDGQLLAYSTDFSGNERFTLRIKDLTSGEVLPDEVPNTFYDAAWSLDGSALFYVTVDDTWRPYRVWRHLVGTPTAEDVMVFEERDEKFSLGVGTSRDENFRLGVRASRDEKWLLIHTSSKLTSEVWLLDAAAPAGEFTVVAPRRHGVEYNVEVAGDRLLILHNDGGAENFELASAPLPGHGNPADWTPVIAHRAEVRLLSVDAFESCLLLSYRRDGLTGLSVLPPSGFGEEQQVTFPEPLYTANLGANPEYSQTRFRVAYNSMVTPATVYDYDPAARVLTVLKQQPVLPSPSGVPYSPSDYEQYREWAIADDGTRVPVSVVCRKGTPRDGSAPCLLYGYGSYEHSIDPGFSIPRLSLLDRGFVYAIAHVRGGGEMGRAWYDHGKMLEKKNTFTDFTACARHLVTAGWTSADRLVARGWGAGGLLMGAAANLAPSAFAGIVAEEPFVDALNAILDPSLPLTIAEWEEWGDPLHDPAVYQYMKSYTPYENVAAARYPAVFALTSLHDSRVLYDEPAKWMARLRSVASGGPFLLKTKMEAGHGGLNDAWQEEALVLAWIITTATGWRPKV